MRSSPRTLGQYISVAFEANHADLAVVGARARAVQRDVVEGYVSLTAAREQYDAALDGRTFAVDNEATREFRTVMRSRGSS